MQNTQYVLHFLSFSTIILKLSCVVNANSPVCRWDGSEGKSAFHQAWWPGMISKPHTVEGELILSYILWCPHIHYESLSPQPHVYTKLRKIPIGYYFLLLSSVHVWSHLDMFFCSVAVPVHHTIGSWWLCCSVWWCISVRTHPEVLFQAFH